jgi:hypothetical protein
VLIMDIDASGGRLEHWLPGTTRRRAQYQEILRTVVARSDADVRLVEHSTTIPPERLDDFKPDGLHRNAAGHRLTAIAIRDEVLDWLRR